MYVKRRNSGRRYPTHETEEIGATQLSVVSCSGPLCAIVIAILVSTKHCHPVCCIKSSATQNCTHPLSKEHVSQSATKWYSNKSKMRKPNKIKSKQSRHTHRNKHAIFIWAIWFECQYMQEQLIMHLLQTFATRTLTIRAPASICIFMVSEFITLQQKACSSSTKF